MQTVQTKKINTTCQRCGICCLMAPCHLGKLKLTDPFKVCIHLSFTKESKASCELLAKEINPFEDGCSFQNDPVYPTFVLMYSKLKEYLITQKNKKEI